MKYTYKALSLSFDRDRAAELLNKWFDAEWELVSLIPQNLALATAKASYSDIVQLGGFLAILRKQKTE